MKKKDISHLLQRYLSGRKEGRDPYFDADEIDEMLDGLEESDDYTYYDEILALGLRLHPGNPDLQIKKCKSYVYNEDYDSALALIDSIADTDNQDLDMLRLECYVSQVMYDKVIEYIEQLITGKCEYLETIFEYIAPILVDMEMDKEARDFIDRGLLLFPDNLILKDELCYNLEIEGNITKAIEICNELIDKNPYSNEYWFTLGRLYSISGDYEKAIEAFDFALTCDESDDELKIMKAYCLFMNENYEKAIEVYNEIAKSDIASKHIESLLAECHIKMGNYEMAYGVLKKMIKQNIQNMDSETYINFIRCCNETNREEEASEALLVANKLFPENATLLSLLAMYYLKSGNDNMALKTIDRLFGIFEKADEKKTEDYENLFHAGQYLFMKGEIDKALIYYNKVLEANIKIPYMHIHIAMAYLAKGDMEHFSEHFSQTSNEELLDYMKRIGFKNNEIFNDLSSNPIPPEDLVKEFLKNKDNNN